MLSKSIKAQIIYFFGKGTTIFTWFVLFGFVMYNFIGNVDTNHNIQYITQMYDPIKTLTMSTWSKSSFFLLTYYPLLLVLPTACAYVSDKKAQVDVYLKGRVGCKNYFRGQFFAVLLVTFVIFTLPFLLEIILSSICFPKEALGDPSNLNYIQTVENTDHFFLYKIYIKNRVLYATVLTFLFGMVSAVLAAFNYAVSTLKIFKFKIFTFFPVYILTYLILFIEKLIKPSYTMNYFIILRMFDITEKNTVVYVLFLAVLFLSAITLIEVKIRKEQHL